MFVKVKLVPRRVRTAATFEAPDPWSGWRPAPFRVEAYRLFPDHVTDPRDFREGTLHSLGSPLLHGIRSEADGVERMLPVFLGEAFTSGKVPPQELPGLLARAAPELRPEDFHPVAGRTAGRAALAGALVALVAAAGLLAAGGNVPRGVPMVATQSEWLARPVSPGQTFAVNGMVPLAGKEPAPAGLRVPEEVARAGGRAFTLAWARTPRGHRALLLPERRYERDGAVDVGYAAVLAPEEVGLGPALEALRRRVPDLEAGTVTASRWVASRPAGAPEKLRIASLLGLLAGLATAIGCGLAWLAHAPRRRRNRTLAARLLGNGVHAPV